MHTYAHFSVFPTDTGGASLGKALERPLVKPPVKVLAKHLSKGLIKTLCHIHAHICRKRKKMEMKITNNSRQGPH